MVAQTGRPEPQFSGRGGAGNFKRVTPASSPAPELSSTKTYFDKPVAGNFSGRGGAGNHRTKSKRDSMPEAPIDTPAIEPSTRTPLVYKGGRGGAGNIEAVLVNEKNKEDLEIQELIRVHSELQEQGALPAHPSERPILRVD